MNIDIVGWYDKANVGDEAFRVVLSKILENHSIKFVCPPQVHNNPDVVLLGGGNVVSKFYLDILPDCPRYALGVGFGYESEIDLMSGYNFKGVMARNVTDLQAMTKKLGCPVRAIPDLAFALTPVVGNKRQKTLGVFLTDYVNPAIDRSPEKFTARSTDFKIKIAKELDSMIDDGWEVVLVPFSTGGYGDDRRINLDVAAFMECRPVLVMDTIGPQDMLNLMTEFDMAVCMRFHAHVFSVIAGTPFVSIDFTRKTSLFLKEYGIQETCCGKFSGDVFNCSLKETLANVYNNAFDYKAKFTDITSLAREELEEAFKTVRQSWFSESL